MMNEQILDFYSLCVVCSDGDKNCVLRRLADIQNGAIISAHISYDKPLSPDNITEVNSFTGIKQLGKVGVWRIVCTPRTTKPDKYVLRAYFQENLHPVQILKWPDRTLDVAKDILFSGFPIRDTFDKSTPVVCLCNGDRGIYSGLFCTKPNWLRIGRGFTDTSKIKLSNGTKVELIENIGAKDIVHFPADDRMGRMIFLRTIDGYKPLNDESTKRVKSAISDHIKQLTTWKTFKAMGVEKRYVQLFWEFLTQLSNGTIYDEIALKCQCSHECAAEHVDEFLKTASSYFESADIDTEILESLVQHNSTLKERCVDLVEIDWKKENHEQVHAAEVALSEIEAQILSKRADLSQLNAEEKTLKNKLDTLRAEIADAETKRGQQTALADDATARIQQKILAARKDVAEFISDISLYMPAATSVARPVKAITYDNLIMDNPSASECEIVDSVDGLISWIDKDLIDAGVDGRKSEALAKYLYACKQAGISLVLAGPGGEAVAKAFSCAITGKYPVQLICDGDWNQCAVDELIQTNSEIVIVKNPFNSKWIDRLPEVIFNTNKIFLLLTPFKDDLVIEPADFYQYAIPLFTSEWIVDSATNDYVCAKLDTAASNKDWAQCEYDISELIIHPTGRMNRRLQNALGIFRELQRTEFKRYMEMYCIKPLLTVLGKTPE